MKRIRNESHDTYMQGADGGICGGAEGWLKSELV